MLGCAVILACALVVDDLGASAGAWEMLPPDGFRIDGGLLTSTSNEGAPLAVYPEAPSGDCLIRAEVRLLGGQRRNVSVAYGIVDGETYEAIRRYDQRQWLEQLEFRAGAVTRVQGNHWLAESGAGSVPMADGEWYRFEVALVGDQVLARCYPREGPETGWLLTTTQRSAAPGRVGIIADQTHIEVASFAVLEGAALEAACGEALAEQRMRALRRARVVLGPSAPDGPQRLSFSARLDDGGRAEMLFCAASAENHYALTIDGRVVTLERYVDGRPLMLAEGEWSLALPAAVEADICLAPGSRPGEFHVGEGLPTPLQINVTVRVAEADRVARLAVADDAFIPGAPGEPYWLPDVFEGTSARYALGDRLGVVSSEGVTYGYPRSQRLAEPTAVVSPLRIRPWRTLRTGDRGGCWLAVGDLTGDGRQELLAVRNEDQAVRAVTAYDLDGRELWRWGGGGEAEIRYDVPCTVYDLDGDGWAEVLLSVEGFLLALDGRTGAEKVRYALPEGLAVADCIIIANLRGLDRASDVIIKTRYDRVWAYTADWEPLWEWAGNTGHHPDVSDVDGDGCDEVLVGFTLLDDDGSVLWSHDLPGHADSARIVQGRGAEPRFLVTCCGGNDMALIALDGAVLWRRQPEFMDHHYQSTHIGNMSRAHPGPEVAVDEGWGRAGRVRTWVVSLDSGKDIAVYTARYPRFARIIDCDGDGLMELFIPSEGRLFDAAGRCVAVLEDALGLGAAGEETPMTRVADLDGDGHDELVLFNAQTIQVYGMPRASTCAPMPDPRGGVNATYY